MHDLLLGRLGRCLDDLHPVCLQSYPQVPWIKNDYFFLIIKD
uniref:Uncharacterized protein n=1 Tax=Yersinia pestis Java 9 TaxID=880632 RepID=E8PSH3_YERPE|nr:hypothetical protein YPJ_pJARS3649 [Yersinia pestis Java 9]